MTFGTICERLGIWKHILIKRTVTMSCEYRILGGVIFLV